MNAISYSLFGWSDNHDQQISFKSYLRGLHLNIRVAQVLYPDWDVCVMADESVLSSPYHELLSDLSTKGKIQLKTVRTAELCLMMLYRLCPLFFNALDGKIKYDRVICRDTDSLLSYRERQAVAYWEQGPKMAHAITDSISHTVTLMGGMIGFKSGPFRDRTAVKSLGELLLLSNDINLTYKGSDQDFLNRYVLPKVHDSITEHFVLGHPQTFRGDCHNFIHDIDLTEQLGGLSEDIYKELNGYGFHIGASGFQTDAVVKWLAQWGIDNEYWEELEKQYPDVMYWQL
jgi:hypothetical protein